MSYFSDLGNWMAMNPNPETNNLEVAKAPTTLANKVLSGEVSPMEMSKEMALALLERSLKATYPDYWQAVLAALKLPSAADVAVEHLIHAGVAHPGALVGALLGAALGGALGSGRIASGATRRRR